MIAFIIVFSVSFFFVFYAMVGYPLLLKILNKLIKPKKMKKDYSYQPNITYMIVAHNEEKSIERKLNGIFDIDYPLEKMQIIIASDFCTDKTNEIVSDFIGKHPELNILLVVTKEHKGKTNAQNEGQKHATGDIIIMSDANSMIDKMAFRELVSCFANEDVWYVCGQLKYYLSDNETTMCESFYLKTDLMQREIESNIQTITAGNGAIYAVKNEHYIDLKPIDCHDATLPYIFALKRKKALYNPMAIAYEKTGQNNGDEFKRKVRMNRGILGIFAKMWKPLNVFKYKWFSFFYFGHRTCRYLIWLNHFIFFVCSIVFAFSGYLIAGIVLIVAQLLFFGLGFVSIKCKIKFKPLSLLGYYSMTVLAQFYAVIKQLSGHSKPVWDKAESTR